MMSVTGMVALISGTLGVWLTIRQSIWCWPFALVATLVSILEFYNQRLFGDMSLQVFYFFAGVYGWAYWNRQRHEQFAVTRTPRRDIPALIIITLVQTVVYYYLLAHFNGDRPFLDGLLTAASLTATYMMTKKRIENWLAWVFIDATYILLYGLKGMWLFMILYSVFTIMALYGWLKWRKTAL